MVKSTRTNTTKAIFTVSFKTLLICYESFYKIHNQWIK